MLKELFEKCRTEVAKETGALQRFVIAAKKENPDVTMNEVKEIAGFTFSEDQLEGEFEDEEEKAKALLNKQSNLNQKWRNSVIAPLQEFLVKQVSENPDKFELEDVPTGLTTEQVFGKKATEEGKKIKDTLNKKYFPRTTRTRAEAVTDFTHLDDLV